MLSVYTQVWSRGRAMVARLPIFPWTCGHLWHPTHVSIHVPVCSPPFPHQHRHGPHCAFCTGPQWWTEYTPEHITNDHTNPGHVSPPPHKQGHTQTRPTLAHLKRHAGIPQDAPRKNGAGVLLGGGLSKWGGLSRTEGLEVYLAILSLLVAGLVPPSRVLLGGMHLSI